MKRQKLHLNKETIRPLGSEQLGGVGGGSLQMTLRNCPVLGGSAICRIGPASYPATLCGGPTGGSVSFDAP